jgi:hypothetical protein
LYLGTENALYVSFDDGENWQPLQLNLPHVPVYGVTVQEHFNDLVLATYGRGFWILDDITALRQMTPDVTSAEAHLFRPRPAYRFRGITPPMAVAYDATDGQNPNYGADINYYLKSAPSGEIQVSILDASGKTVRSLKGTKNPGINRVWWDLRYLPSPEIVLRTPPMHASWLKVSERGRPIGGRMSLLALPGTYQVKLTVNGHDFTQPLTVIKDPHSGGSEADIRIQFAFLQSVQENLQQAGAMIEQIENTRKQLESMNSGGEGGSDAQVKSGSEDLDRKLIAVEENLYQLRITGGQDGMRWPTKLVEKLTHIASELQDADFAPTSQQIAVNQQLTHQIHQLQSQLKQVMNKDVAQFNDLLRQNKLPLLAVASRVQAQELQ